MKPKRAKPPGTAVALQYDGRAAPRVTAKGKGEVAERILEIAQAHDVPMRADPQLVQLLAAIDLGHEIPPALYVAVAQVLAFAYRLSGKVPALEAGGERDSQLASQAERSG